MKPYAEAGPVFRHAAAKGSYLSSGGFALSEGIDLKLLLGEVCASGRSKKFYNIRVSDWQSWLRAVGYLKRFGRALGAGIRQGALCLTTLKLKNAGRGGQARRQQNWG